MGGGRCCTGQPQTKRVRARFLIDATGRSALIAKANGHRRNFDTLTAVALVERSGSAPTDATVEWVRMDGGIEHAMAPEFPVTVFLSSLATIRELRLQEANNWRDLVNKTEFIGRLSESSDE